jgi:hypothetical protein
MQVIRLIAAFAFVFGLLGLFAFVSRRKSKPNRFAISQFRGLNWPSSLLRLKRKESVDGKPAPLRVLKRTSLTPTHHLHLVSIHSTRLLICTHPSGCTVLHEDEDAESELGKGSHQPANGCANGDRFLAEMSRHAE